MRLVFLTPDVLRARAADSGILDACFQQNAFSRRGRPRARFFWTTHSRCIREASTVVRGLWAYSRLLVSYYEDNSLLWQNSIASSGRFVQR